MSQTLFVFVFVFVTSNMVVPPGPFQLGRYRYNQYGTIPEPYCTHGSILSRILVMVQYQYRTGAGKIWKDTGTVVDLTFISTYVRTCFLLFLYFSR